ncbi:hypothetical protein D3C81_1572970 [compost metagenome]
MLGDARAGNVVAAADSVEQEGVVRRAFWQRLPAQFKPGLQFFEGPGRRILDQLPVAFAQHLQAARLEVDLLQVDVHRLRFAHAGAIQQRDDRRITNTLRARIGGADIHQFANQATAQVAPWRQAAAGCRLDLTNTQQLLVIDQALAPGFIHHAAYCVDIKRRTVGRIAIGAQCCNQADHMSRLKLVPWHIDEVAINETQPVGSVLQDVAHGLLAGRRQPGEVLQQWILRKVGQNVNPVAKPGAP